MNNPKKHVISFIYDPNCSLDDKIKALNDISQCEMLIVNDILNSFNDNATKIKISSNILKIKDIISKVEITYTAILIKLIKFSNIINNFKE